jgi:iron complex transport system ATP-binding protein
LSITLEIANVSFQYHSDIVLDGIKLEIKENDFWGIIGPNGSGKSTLLKTMNGILQPQKGVVILKGWDITKLARTEVAKELAVVPQDTTVGFNFSAEEVVAMGRTPYLARFQKESKRDREIIKQAMELARCGELKDRFINELSGGERQRVILARALAQEPRLLLLDEPTSQLDISFQTEIFDLLRRLNEEKGIAIIAVLHDLNLSAQYCKKLLLLNKGKIFAAGSPAEVITEENINKVYQTKVLIEHHPLSGLPQVILLPEEKRRPKRDFIYERIHIIAGGGSAGNLYQELCNAGLELSSGVLNIGDSDWQQAQKLGLKVVDEKPFSPISMKAHRQHLELVERAEAIIITGVPFGHGNMLNLKAALEFCRKGRPVYILNETHYSKRDYTGGKASVYIKKLTNLGAKIIDSREDLWKILNKNQ